MDNYAVFAKDQKDIPQWMKDNHDWQTPVEVNKLPKLELKVKMCCPSCEEKAVEEIREVNGVFDVKTDRSDQRVTVVLNPGANASHSEILKKAKKVDKKAWLVETKKEPAKPNPNAEGKEGSSGKKPIEPTQRPTNPSYGNNMPFITNHNMPFITNHNMPFITNHNLPFITNYNYMKRRVYCSSCTGYTNVACANCGRQS